MDRVLQRAGRVVRRHSAAPHCSAGSDAARRWDHRHDLHRVRGHTGPWWHLRSSRRRRRAARTRGRPRSSEGVPPSVRPEARPGVAARVVHRCRSADPGGRRRASAAPFGGFTVAVDESAATAGPPATTSGRHATTTMTSTIERRATCEHRLRAPIVPPGPKSSVSATLCRSPVPDASHPLGGRTCGLDPGQSR